VDTSVFGGVFDPEFERASKAFFDQARHGRFIIVSSVVVQSEIEPAPENVKDLFRSLIPYTESVRISDEALKLRSAYIRAGIVSEKYTNDALHVAIATVCECPIIVSWNFRHIVHHDKIPLYNAVNIIQGYHTISINTPAEVIYYEEDI